ncbi:MAG: glycerol-3-phosphate 1-O-acyltransferase PlsY [Bacteroidales bacterium]|nr:glycerol-3-phosphate 1-O-acyltransferase PlsY [Bacteroidales bacterium]MCB9000017.1 glycerol-3-phosphate 1-O-acyltransferase PlsY [Bacteroidales bacterium]MCB9013253.1 glycerol-3-phosphate 1-O-acyltransferase PlsY [Bacteroidales bacterium]
MDLFLMLISSYLIGAIPTSIWIGKIFFRIDIREFGSGNAGASNAFRVFGPIAGSFVLLFDIFKGYAAVNLVQLFSFLQPGSDEIVNVQIILGIAAVLGHIYPIYEGFRGGKGVATVFGVLLALHPLATVCAAGVFVVAFFATRYSSVGSILAGLSFPIWIIFVFTTPHFFLKIFSLLVAVLLIFTHRKNVVRLWNGNENKTSIFSKSSS